MFQLKVGESYRHIDEKSNYYRGYRPGWFLSCRIFLEKGYEVHGIKRRSSLFNTQRVDHIYQSPHSDNRNFILHYGDLTDSSNLIRLVKQIQPDEIYNLGAQSHVAVSFESPDQSTLQMLMRWGH